MIIETLFTNTHNKRPGYKIRIYYNFFYLLSLFFKVFTYLFFKEISNAQTAVFKNKDMFVNANCNPSLQITIQINDNIKINLNRPKY